MRRALLSLWLPALLASTLLGGLATEAQAQDTTLVSNTIGSPNATSKEEVSTSFTTGSNSTGYTITSIDIGIYALGSRTAAVAIRESNSSNQPGDLVARLTDPSSFTNRRLNTFTAPTNTMLDPDTTYFIVFNDGSGRHDDNYGVSLSDSDSETGAPGWSIGDGSIGSGVSTRSIRFAITGRANPELVNLSKPPVSLTELGGAAATGAYTVILNVDPGTGKTIVLTASSDDAGAVTVTPATALYFSGGSGGNWNIARTLTVTAVNDGDIANESVTISHALGGGAGTPYENATPGKVRVNVTDAGHGVIASETALTVDENDDTYTYTLRLKSDPGGPVTITPASGDAAVATVAPAVSFPTGGWQFRRSVTVTGKETGSTSITHSVTTGVTGTYPTSLGGLPTVAVTVEDVIVPIGGPHNVPNNWGLKPSAIGVGGSFRLLFITDTVHNAASAAISRYNGHVQYWAERGHSDIQRYADDFRAVGSTATVDARDNVEATGAGVPIYWLDQNGNGGKVADDYTEFWSGVWDSNDSFNRRNRLGGGNSQTIQTADTWTGTGIGGTKGAFPLGSAGVSIGGSPTTNAIAIGVNVSAGAGKPFYALSPVFKVVSGPRFTLSNGGRALRVTELGGDAASATYTVSLDTDPGDGNTVTVDPNSSEPALVTVSPAGALSFTGGNSGNWDTPQTVTVTAVNDGDTRDHTVLIGHAVGAAGTPYNGVSVPRVTVNVTDAGHGVLLSETALEVDEGDDTVTYTVRLKSSPNTSGVGRVNIYAVSDNATRATVTSTQLSFTSNNWSVPQTVTVTGKEAGDTFVYHEIRQRHNTTVYSITGINQKPDQLPVTVDDVTTRIGGPHNVPNNWGLKPSAIGVGGSFRLLFITDNWHAETSAAISRYNGHVQYWANRGHSEIQPYGDDFRAVGSTATVDAIDNVEATGTGVPIYWLDANGNGGRVADDYAEFWSGNWDDYASTHRRNRLGQASNPGTRTDWPWTGTNIGGRKAGTVHLGALDVVRGQLPPENAINVNAFVSTERGKGHSFYALSPVFTVAPSTVDLSRSSVTLTELGAAAATDTYTVVLDSDPGAGKTVTVTASSDDTGAVTVTPSTALSFTGGPSGTWKNPRTLTVTAVNDGDISNETVTVSHALGGAAGTPYEDVMPGAVTVNVTDAGHAVIASETALTVDEDDATASYTLRLASDPGGTVTLAPASGDAAVATVVAQAASFNSGDWQTPQTVTVTVKEAGGTNITHTVTAATTNYPTNLPDLPTVAVTVEDVITAIGGPHDVPDNWALKPTAVNVGQSFRLLFVTADWHAATSAAISRYNAHVQSQANGGHSAIRAYSDDFRVVGSTATVDAIDNVGGAGAGVPIYWLDENGNGGKVADDYAGFWAKMWTNNASTDRRSQQGQASAGATATNWTWTGSDEDGTASAHPLGSAFPSRGGFAESGSGSPLQVILTDINAGASRSNALYALSPVFTVTAPAITLSKPSLALTELHATDSEDTYTVALNVDPGDSVTVTVTPTSGNTGAVTVAPLSLAFTGGADGDWNTAKTFTVTAVNDGNTAGETVSITHAATASDTANPYHDIAIDPLSVTVTDAGHGVIASKTALTVDEGDDTAAYTLRLASDPGGTVTLAPASGDAGVATASAAVSFNSGNWETPQPVTVTGKEPGSTEIAHTVTAATTDYPANLPDLPTVAVTVEDVITAIGGPHDVPDNWGLKPTALGVGQSFRLLFITDDWIDATSASIATYNAHVQSQATGGHSAIRAYSDDFRAVGSTATVDAIDNVEATGTGVPIYWLDENGNGGRVADDYAEFWSGGWDNYASSDRRSAMGQASNSGTQTDLPWTGTNIDGRKHGLLIGAGFTYFGSERVMRGWLPNENPISRLVLPPLATEEHSIYALSPVFAVVAAPPGVTLSKSSLTLTELGGAAATDTYTVRLATDPGTDKTVTVTASSDDTGAVTVTPDTALSFTGGPRGDWTTARTLTVTAVGDGDLTNESVTVSHALGGATGTPYENVMPDAVTVNVTDAGHAVIASETALTVDEGDDTATYTLRLASDPGGAVTVTPASGNAAVATVVAQAVSFNSGNWETPQTVTVTGKEAGGTDITHTIGPATTNYPADLANLPTVAVTVDDVTTPIGGPHNVPDNWALKPTGLSVGQSFRLLFMTDNWRNAQSHAISTYNEHMQGQANAGHSAIRRYGNDFRVVGSTATVDAIDNLEATGAGEPIYWLDENGSGAKVADNYAGFWDGGWDNYAGADRRNRLGKASGDPTDWPWTGTLNTGAKSGNPLGDATPSRGRLPPNSPLQGGPLGNAPRAQSHSFYALSPVFTVVATPPGVTVTKSSLTLTELGGDAATDTYTVVLDTDPGASNTVTVTASSDDTGAVTVTPDTALSFTGGPSGTWKTPRTLTVSAVNDGDTSSESATVTHAVSATAGTPYADVTDVAVTVNVTDAGHAVIASETELTVDEGDDTATYTLRLASDPGSGTVTITPAGGIVTFTFALGGSATRTVATVSSAVSFNSDNWHTPKAVTVTGKEAGSTSITHSVTAGVTGAYPTTLSPLPTVAVTVEDVTTAIGGPHDVSDNWALKPTGLGVSDSFRLLFITDNWHDSASAAISRYNTHAQSQANGGHSAIRPYSDDFRVVGSTATVDAIDNVAGTGAGVPIYWLDASGGGALVADDYADFWDNRWDNNLSTDRRNRLGQASNSSTQTDWPWTGTLHDGTGTASTHPLGTAHPTRGAHGATSSPLHHVLTDINVTSNNAHAFYVLSPVFTVASIPPGVTLSETSRTVVELGGDAATATYTVRLATDPGASTTVTVTASSGDATAATVSPTNALSFTGGSGGTWNAPQTVTVTAVNDPDVDSESFNITHAVSAPNGNDYESVVAGAVAVTATDAGHGVIASASTLGVRENDGTAEYTLRLKSAPGGSVTVTPDSSDDTHATVSAGVSFSDSDSDWRTEKTVTVTGKGDATDTASISHTITTGTTAYPTNTLTGDLPAVAVTVTADTRPTFAAGAITQTGATLTLGNGPTDWWYRRNLPTPIGACTSVTGASVTLTGLDTGVEYTYAAYSDSACATELNSAIFRTDPPTASIAASDAVVEGNPASFTVTLTPAPPADVTVRLGIGGPDSGGFVDGGNLGLRTVTVGTAGTAPYTVTTAGDGLDETNGSVGVRLLASNVTPDTYTRASTSFFYTPIIDDDPTTVTLARAGSGPIAEDGTATVTVTLGRKLGEGETVTAPLAVSGANITAADYTLALSSGGSLNDGVSLNTTSPHSPAQPAVVFIGHATDTVQIATLTLTAQDDSDDEGASETLAIGFGIDDSADDRRVMSNLDRADTSTSGTGGTAPTGTASVEITDDDASLDAGAVTRDGATLTLNHGTNPWYYKRITPADTACTMVSGSASVTLSGLVAGTDYTYAAYSDSTCATELASVDFTTAAVTAGVILSKPSLTVVELGGDAATATYTVKLATDPGASTTVTVTASSGDATAATVDPATALSFTGGPSGTWAAPQTVTVTAVNDPDAVGESFNITHAVGAPNGNDYESVVAGAVAVTTTDAGHGVIANPTMLDVRANDGTAAYTLRLKSQPGGTVGVTPTSGTPSHATVSGPVSFGAADWDTEKPVTVTGKGDATDTATITHAITGTGDTTNYPTGLTGLPTVTVTVTADTSPMLAHSAVSQTAATLTLSNGPTDWWYRQNLPTPVGACTAVTGRTSVDLSGLTAATAYTYAAYSDSACATALDSATFTTSPPNPTVSLSVSATTVAEGATALTLTAMRSATNDSGAALTIPIRVKTLGTTAQTTDYELGAGFISIADTESTGTTTFTAKADGLDEQAETVIVELHTPPAGTDAGTPSEVTITITDNNPTRVTLRGAAGNIAEGGTKPFTVELARALLAGETLTAPLTFQGTATRGTDYTTTCASLAGVACDNLDSGAAAVTFTGSAGGGARSVALTLTASTDSLVESTPETVDIGLGTPTAATLAGGAATTDSLPEFSITDVDGIAPRVASIERQTPPSSPTNADSLTWRVTFNEAVRNVGAADFTIANTTATHTVTPVTGAATTTYDVTASDGNLAGLDATVTLSFAGAQDIEDLAGNALADTMPTGANEAIWVLDNTAPTLTITVPATSAGPFTADFVFSEAVTGFALDEVDVTNGAATSLTGMGTDWEATITPTANGNVDVDVEADVAMDTAGNGNTVATRARSVYTAPADPVVSIAGGGAAVTEGTAATFTVTATPPPAANLTVNLSVADAPDADFVTAANEGAKSVVIMAGMSTADYTVATAGGAGETADEPNGPVTVTVTSGSGYAPGAGATARGAVTVNDDDATTVTLAGAAGNIAEGETKTVTVTLGRGLYNGEILPVPLTFGGAATRGADYTTACATVANVTCASLNSGAAMVTFTGPVTGQSATTVTLTLSASTDSDAEGAETVTIGLGTLNTASGADLGGGATGSGSLAFSITNVALPAVSLSVSASGAAAEGGAAPLTLTATRNVANTSGVALSIPIRRRAAGSTAVAADYTLPAAIAIPNNMATGTATFTVTDDGDDEPPETLVVELGTPLPAGTAAGTPSEVTITIADNDPTTVTLARGGGSGPIAEDGTATVTVTLGRRMLNGETVTAPLAVSGAGITAADYTLTRATGASLNTGVSLLTSAPHSAAEPAVVFTGDSALLVVVQTATLTLTALDDSDDEGTEETLTIGFGINDGADDRRVMSNLDRADTSTSGITGTTPTGTVSVVITDNDDPEPMLAHGSVTRNAATLTLSNHTGNWYYRRTLPTPIGSCDGPETGASVALAGLTPSTAYTYAAYSDSACANELADATFTTGAPLPVIAIAAGASPVTEGANASFTVSASPAPTTDLTVSLTVADAPNADFVTAANTGAKTVIISANTASAPYNVITEGGVGETADEPNGPVTVTVTADSSYEISGTNASAAVAVNDNDATPVTLAGAAGDIAEGGTKTFTVTLDRGLYGGETLPVPLSFTGGATRGADYTTTCASATGVNCASLNSGSATVTFAGTSTQQSATTVTLTLSATTDTDDAEGNETVDIDLGTLNASSGSGLGGGAAGADNLVDFNITNVDATAPRVTSIARQAPNKSPTNADSLTWRVTFNEAVRNVGAADFDLTGATATPTVAVVADTNDTTWDVTASGGNLASLSATVTLSFDSTQDIADTSGNTLINTTPTGDNVASYEVDNTRPTLTIDNVPGASSTAFETTFSFSESVTGFALDNIAVTNGVASGLTGADGDTTYTATITPADDGDVHVDVAAGVATDTAGNANTAANRATSTFTAPTDPVVVALYRVGSVATEMAESERVEFQVKLGRELGPGEVVDVPLAVSGSGVTTADWRLTGKTGAGLNTGVTLSGENTATPKLRFSGAGAQTATLELTALTDGVAEPNSETFTVALGPDGTGANGFDHASLATNVRGGADPHPTQKEFSQRVHDFTVGWVETTALVSEDAGMVRLTLKLSSARATDTNVPLRYASSSALVESDFWQVSSSVTMRAGATEATVDVPILEDTLVEGDESFGVEIDESGLPSGMAVAGNRGAQFVLVTIVDNDDDTSSTVSLGASEYGAAEGDGVSVMLKLSPTRRAATAIPIACTDATATSGADYTACPASVTVPANDSSVIFTIDITQDTKDEVDETFTLAIGTLPDLIIQGTPASATVTIANKVADFTDFQTVVNYLTEVRDNPENTAVKGNPAHIAKWNQVLAAIGDTSSPEDPMPASEIHTNAARWPNSAFAPASIYLKSLDANKPEITVTAVDSVTEGEDATFTVTANPAPTSPLVVSVTVATMGDYGFTGITDTVTIDTSGSGTLTLGTTDDKIGEPKGSVGVTVNDQSDYRVGSPASKTVTVRDNDVYPEITVTAGATVTEGGDAIFTITATPPPAADLMVSVTVATSGDYGFTDITDTVTIDTSGSETLTLGTTDDNAHDPPGSVTVTVNDGDGYTVGAPASDSVAVTDDDPDFTNYQTVVNYLIEVRDNPENTVVKGNPAHIAKWNQVLAAIGYTNSPEDPMPASEIHANAAKWRDSPFHAASVYLKSLDPNEPEITVTAADAVTEGENATFTITANPAPTSPLAVSVAVTTTGDYDFTGITESITIPTTGSAMLKLGTTDDSIDEVDGSVTLTVNDDSGYRVGSSASKKVTVKDNDDDATGLPVLSVADASAREGEGPMVFTIRLSKASKERVGVIAVTLPVTAEEHADYAPVGRRLWFEPGETEHVVNVEIVDDNHDDDGETFRFVLASPQGATLGNDEAVGTINNSDPMPAAYLARFGRALAEQALDGITERIEAPRGDTVPGFRGSFGSLQLGGGAGFGNRDCQSADSASTSAEEESTNETTPGSEADPGLNRDGAASAECDRFAPLGAVIGFIGGLTGNAGNNAGMNTDINAGIGGVGGNAGSFGEASVQPGGAGGFNGGGDSGGPLSDSLRAKLQRMLLDSRFTYNGEADDAGGVLGFWGRGAQTRFSGSGGELGLDGEVTTALLGADYARNNWLVGVALTQSASRGGYRGGNSGTAGAAGKAGSAGVTGDVETELTTAIPYASWRASERLSVWGAAGYGAGEVTLEPGGAQSLTTGIDWTMAAAGVRSDLAAFAGGTKLALLSDALWVNTGSDRTGGLVATDAGIARLRLGLEGSRRFDLPGGGSLKPKLELGVRHDGGDAETGFGVEVGGGIGWTAPGLGLELDLKGRALLAHEDGAMRDRGFSAALAWDPRPDSALGLGFALRQDIGGRASGGLNALFDDDPLARRMGGQNAGRWTAEMGYGLSAFRGRFIGTPHLDFGVSPGSREIGAGWRLAPLVEEGAPDLSLTIQATRREGLAAPAEHRIGIEVRYRW